MAPALTGQSIQAEGVGGSGSGAELEPRRIVTAGQYSGAAWGCCPASELPNSAVAASERQPIASMHLNVPSQGTDCESSDSCIIFMQSSDMFEAVAEDEAIG